MDAIQRQNPRNPSLAKRQWFGLEFQSPVVLPEYILASNSSPLGTTSWTLGYIRGGPPDFEIQDRTTAASRGWDYGDFGAELRPFHNKLAHAYFTQTVTNLAVGQPYTVSGWMSEDWWSAPSGTNAYNPTSDGKRNSFLVYIEAIGGLGTLTSDGRHSRFATNATPA